MSENFPDLQYVHVHALVKYYRVHLSPGPSSPLLPPPSSPSSLLPARIFDTEPPRLSVKSHYDLTVGQTNVLECTGYFHSVLGFLGWRRSGMEDTYTSINQDPFCNSTVEVMHVNYCRQKFLFRIKVGTQRALLSYVNY